MAKEIPLTQGYVAIVDDEDFETLSHFKWSADIRVEKIGSRVEAKRSVRIDGRSVDISLSRQIMNAGPGEDVDHKNGDTLDYRRENLRIATKSQNAANRRKSSFSSSPFKGIYFHKGKQRWLANACLKGKRVHLGSYATPEEAAKAYDDAARRLHGDFARVNFPKEGEQRA